ncbi:hypothetical protein LC612_30690 [Nostoc sp. CHAB 5834]|nr:hypothetical protein [Nostoc sp. CHAB 5834]
MRLPFFLLTTVLLLGCSQDAAQNATTRAKSTLENVGNQVLDAKGSALEAADTSRESLERFGEATLEAGESVKNGLTKVGASVLTLTEDTEPSEKRD